jgi:hypothetical protein
VEHVHGTTNTDIRKAKHALEVYDFKTVKENISYLEEAFLNLNNAQPVPLTLDEMTYYLQEKFCLDGRICVQSIMATSKANTIKALVEVDPPVVTRHKMAALVGEKEICRNNLAGRCNLGDKCPRSHEVPCSTSNKDSLSQEWQVHEERREASSSKIPFPVTVTREHRAAVGPPRGRQTDKNALGWSKAQMNVLQHVQETAPQDTWSFGNPEYFTAQDGTQHRAHFNMLNVASSAAAAPRWRQQEPALCRFLKAPDQPGRKESDTMIINEIKQYYLRNRQYAKQGLPRPHHNFIVYLHLHGNNDRYVGRAPLQPNFQDESALFCALGWYKSVEMMRQFGKARSDVKLGIPNLYSAIFNIGEQLFHASVTDHDDTSATRTYTSFGPTNGVSIHPGNPGNYSSNLTGIPDYFMVFTDVEKLFQDDYVRDMVLLTMYYDLMAYLAQSYARSVSVGLTLLQARTTVVAQLVSLLALPDLAPNHDIIKTMTTIAKQVKNAPPLPPPPRQQPVRRSRFSCAVMIAPPDGYLPPRSSDTQDEEVEDDDEDDNDEANSAEDNQSTDHSIPEYEEDTYSTHSTPQRRTSTSSVREPEYVPRRLSHPSYRPAQAPTPVRALQMMSPLGKRTSPSGMIRKPLRFPQTIVRKQKQSSPQQIIPDAIKSSPASPVRLEKSRRSSSSPKDEQTLIPEEHDEAVNLLQINAGHHTFNSLARKSSVIVIDSGASMSGTGDRALPRNIRPTTLTVSSAFSDSAQPTEMGDLKTHMIPKVFIDAMKNTTLLPVSQLCVQKIPLCGIFSPVDCRFFPFHQMLPYLKQVCENCDEVLRGKVETGLYVMESH